MTNNTQPQLPAIRKIKSTTEIKIGDTMIYTGQPRGTGAWPPEIGSKWEMKTKDDISSVSIEIIERGRGWWPLEQSATQLPAEVVAEIESRAEAHANVQCGSKAKGTPSPASWEDSKEDYIAGATEYATKLHEAEQDKDKALDLLNEALVHIEYLENKFNCVTGSGNNFKSRLTTFLDGKK